MDTSRNERGKMKRQPNGQDAAESLYYHLIDGLKIAGGPDGPGRMSVRSHWRLPRELRAAPAAFYNGPDSSPPRR